MAADQLPLAFDFRPALGGDDFMVAPPNADAVAWLDRWPDWPTPALVIHGPAGCGKSHLAQVFLALSRGRPLTAALLREEAPPVLVASAPALVIDGAEAMLAADLERQMFHLVNAVAEARRHLLITAQTAPVQWAVGLPDLASRLKAAMSCGIGPPDDALIAALLVKLFADRQLRVDEGVVTFLQARMERSFDAARRLVAALDEASLAQRRAITVPLARDVLARMDG